MIRIRTQLSSFISLLVLALVLIISHCGTAFADSKEFNFTTGCSESVDGSYTAILDISTAKNVYAKLGTRGQSLQVRINQVNESLEGGCRIIGSTVLNGDTWTKVGTIIPSDGRVVLELISPKLTNVPNANRPAVLLLDPENPVCVPKVECELVQGSEKAYIKAPTTLRDKASLLVGIPASPDYDSLNKVDYYVSGKLAYSTSKLLPFDMRYVSYPRQQLLRVSQYQSGQQVVHEQIVPDNFNDSLFNLIYRTFGLGRNVSKLIFAIILVITLLILTYRCMQLYVQHYRRLVYHGLLRMNTFRQRIALYVEILLERVDYALERFFSKKFIVWVRRNKTTLKYIGIFWLIPLFVIGLYFTVKNNVATIYHVNGESMTSTFQDKQSMLVYRLPQTIAHFNHERPTLHRGDVVVINAVYGLVSPEQIQENEHIIVKRVLGLPGERVTVINGVVTVYNEDNVRGFKVDKGSGWEKTMHKDTSDALIDIKLASDEVFVAGDNRPGSVDSRLNGPLKIDQVIGRVVKHW